MAKLLVAVAGLALLVACATPLERASARYRKARDFQSLQMVHENLRQGLPRQEVERLLGPPDYSPTDGQYYYSSNQRNRVLVLDYREGDQVTDRLRRFELETIGE